MQHLQNNSNWTHVPAWTKKDAKESQQQHCKGCALGKMTMSHFDRTLSTHHHATAAGELIFMDTWFSNVPSISGRKCVLIFVDAFSRKLWLKYMNKKEEAAVKIQEWVAERKLEGINLNKWSVIPRATTLKSDNGGELKSHLITEMLKKEGLTPEYEPPRVHCIEVERQIRTIKESTAAFLQAAKIELTRAASARQFWNHHPGSVMNHSLFLFLFYPTKLGVFLHHHIGSFPCSKLVAKILV
jgi:hypothetical protein